MGALRQVIGLDGDVLTITEDTAGKARFRNSIIDTDGTRRPMTDAEFAAKLRAEAHIDELGQVSQRGNKTVPDTKKHAFATDGFNYRTAYFLDNDGNYYRVTMSVGKNGDINTIYNVGKLKGAQLPHVAQRPATNVAMGRTPSINSIRENGGKYNSNFNQDYQGENVKNSTGEISLEILTEIITAFIYWLEEIKTEKPYTASGTI